MQRSNRPVMALVAASNRYEAQIVRDILVRTGIMRIVEAQDGAEALVALTEQKPQLVVLDWDIPVVAARELVNAARDNRDDRPGIVVTMSAPTRSAVSAARALAIDSIIVSPFSPRAFMDRLRPVVSGGAFGSPR